MQKYCSPVIVVKYFESGVLPCRILFWTDWDASLPRIEAASMSGEGRKTIHKETGNGGWPNGLTVDYLERRILWIDARSNKYGEKKSPSYCLLTIYRES